MTQQRESDLPTEARWLRESRRAAGFSNVHKLLDAMAEAGLKPPSYGSYAQWESGTVRPRVESLESLRRFYADRAPDVPVVTEPVDPVVAAIDRQTAAIEKLTGQIERLLSTRDQDLEQLANAIGRALQGRADPERAPAA